MEKIESRDNGRVKNYGKIASSRKYREKTGRFVIEGRKLFEEASLCGVETELVFVTQAFLAAHPETAALLAKRDRAFLIPPGVEGKISQSQSPQGIYAVCKKLDKRENLDTIDSNGFYLALWDLQDPGNVGTVIRCADAMGISGVVLSRGCCDLYSLKTLRAAMGSIFRVPIWVTDMEAFLETTALKSYAAVVDPGAQKATETDFRGSVTVIGNEGNGLSEAQRSCCQCPITSPMRGNAESLNAAMAASILIWEMARQVIP